MCVELRQHARRRLRDAAVFSNAGSRPSTFLFSFGGVCFVTLAITMVMLSVAYQVMGSEFPLEGFVKEGAVALFASALQALVLWAPIGLGLSPHLACSHTSRWPPSCQESFTWPRIWVTPSRTPSNAWGLARGIRTDQLPIRKPGRHRQKKARGSKAAGRSVLSLSLS